MLRKASQISLLAASSPGKCPRVLKILRSRALTLSMAWWVNDPANRRRKGKERNDPIPGPMSGGGYGREFPSPVALGECFQDGQDGQGGFGTAGGADGLDRCRQGLAILPAGIVQAVADQMHDAAWQGRGRRDRGQCFRSCFKNK